MKVYHLIIVAGVCVVGAGLIFGVSNCRNMTGTAQTAAQTEANRFLSEMGIKGRAVCSRADTDGDGYISCPYVLEGKDELHPLECACGLIASEGCRPPKAIFTGPIQR